MKLKSLDEQLELFTEPLSDYDKNRLEGKTTSTYSSGYSSYPNCCTGTNTSTTTELTADDVEEMATQNDYNPDVGLWNYEREEFVFVPLHDFVDFQTNNRGLDEEAMSRAFFKSLEENYDIVPMHQEFDKDPKK